MFNFFKSDKDKKLEAIGKQILLWNKACMVGVDESLLKEPRPQVGAILFFLGGIDNLCQANQIDDKTFAKLSMELLDIMGFKKEFTVPILKNFYLNRPDNEFALQANIEGGKKITDFLSGKNKMAPLAFGAFVREWTEEPNLKPEDVALFEV